MLNTGGQLPLRAAPGLPPQQQQQPPPQQQQPNNRIMAQQQQQQVGFLKKNSWNSFPEKIREIDLTEKFPQLLYYHLLFLILFYSASVCLHLFLLFVYIATTAAI